MYFIVYSSVIFWLEIDVPSEHTEARDKFYWMKYAPLFVFAILVVTPRASIAQSAVVGISNPNSVMRYCVVLLDLISTLQLD